VKRLRVLALSVSVAAATTALACLAHGHAEHGGEFAEVDEYTFELCPLRQGETTTFSLWIKDPAQKPVTAGDVTLKLRLSGERTATIALKPTGSGSFSGTMSGLRRGRYRASADLLLKGRAKLTPGFSVKVP